MNWFVFAVVLPVTFLFVCLIACSVHWAVTHGQGPALWRAVRSWFDRSANGAAVEAENGTASDAARASPQT